jgi:eukaryotic-like serine/threonine-protein kinase
VSGSDQSLVGQLLLGRYRVLRRIALGGMGAVYLARIEGARGFSKPVVVKRILPIWGDDDEITSLFAREARILSQLQDPGIVSVIDFGQIHDGTPVMVLDYVHGYHLAHWLSYLRATQGQMPVEMAVHIMLRVLSALHYAHTFIKPDGKALAVIHRDVSPTNILLDISGNVKLVDFGIARVEGDSNEYKTEAPQLRGKFGYLAPELFAGAEPSAGSDVYAAGVVLYELLIGDNPFRGRELTESYHKALQLVAESADELRPDVPRGLAEVIERALAKEPAQRYDSASEFADALRVHRPAPDELCQARLRAAVQSAFAGPLADVLGIEPLSASDEAWRDAADGGPSLETALAVPVPGGTLRASFGIRSPPAGTGELSDALEPENEEPTLRRGQLQSSNPPGPALQRLRLVMAASAMLLGALLVGTLVRWMQPKESVIVIERESTRALDSAPAPAGAPDEVSDDELAGDRPSGPQADHASAGVSRSQVNTRAVGKTPIANALPVSPEPALLTNIFAREQSRIQRCFTLHAEADTSRNPITVEFRVDASGTVGSAQLLPVEAEASALGACLLSVARATRFPRLTHVVTFRIPIQARVAQ